MSITLTKYQASKVMELMCPNCGGELAKKTNLECHCSLCNVTYRGEEKKDTDGPSA